MRRLFFCPKCNKTDVLDIVDSIEIRADEKFDEIAIQLVNCTKCPNKGMAIFTESKDKGAMQQGYWLGKDEYDALKQLFEKKAIKELEKIYKEKFCKITGGFSIKFGV